MKKEIPKKKQVTKIVLGVVLGLAAVELCAIGYLGGLGPLGFLRTAAQGRMPGNKAEYSFDSITSLPDSPLKGKKICVLGSSVVYGHASQKYAVGEYLERRFDCELIKEAVSGTTLVEKDEKSYIRRMV